MAIVSVHGHCSGWYSGGLYLEHGFWLLIGRTPDWVSRQLLWNDQQKERFIPSGVLIYSWNMTFSDKMLNYFKESNWSALKCPPLLHTFLFLKIVHIFYENLNWLWSLEFVRLAPAWQYFGAITCEGLHLIMKLYINKP